MDTLTATKTPTRALVVGETIAPTVLPGLPVAVSEAPQPPKPSRFSDAWERAKASPHGRALQTIAAGTGGFLTGVTPALVLGGVGYAIGSHNPYELSAGVGASIGVVAGLLVNAAQFGYRGLVETFRKLGHKHPHFASAVNATLCTALPTAAAGMTTAHYADGAWGVAAGVAAGILGAIYCEMVQNERRKDANARPTKAD